jgi:hypothetical protein
VTILDIRHSQSTFKSRFWAEGGIGVGLDTADGHGWLAAKRFSRSADALGCAGGSVFQANAEEHCFISVFSPG